MDTVSMSELTPTSIKHARYIASELEQLSVKSLAAKKVFEDFASQLEKGEVQIKN